MRIIDDKIIYAINQSIPTASFKGQIDATEKCKSLHTQVTLCKIAVISGPYLSEMYLGLLCTPYYTC